MKPEYRAKLVEQGLKRAPDAKVHFVEVKSKSRAGIEYIKYEEVIVPYNA